MLFFFFFSPADKRKSKLKKRSSFSTSPSLGELQVGYSVGGGGVPGTPQRPRFGQSEALCELRCVLRAAPQGLALVNCFVPPCPALMSVLKGTGAAPWLLCNRVSHRRVSQPLGRVAAGAVVGAGAVWGQ